MRGSIYRIASAGPHKNQAQMFGAGQFQQVSGTYVTAFETLLGRLTNQLARRVKGPCVKGAGQAGTVIAMGLAFFHQFGTAVCAHVAKSPHNAIFAACDEDGGSGCIAYQ